MADSIQTLNQLVTNYMTKMLQVLENEGNFNEFLDSTSELFEAGRVLAFQVFEILEENGITTEAMVNDFSRAVNQSQSLDAEAQESWQNLRQQVQLNKYETAPKFIQSIQNLTSDCLLI